MSNPCSFWIFPAPIGHFSSCVEPNQMVGLNLILIARSSSFLYGYWVRLLRFSLSASIAGLSIPVKMYIVYTADISDKNSRWKYRYRNGSLCGGDLQSHDRGGRASRPPSSKNLVHTKSKTQTPKTIIEMSENRMKHSRKPTHTSSAWVHLHSASYPMETNKKHHFQYIQGYGGVGPSARSSESNTVMRCSKYLIRSLN